MTETRRKAIDIINTVPEENLPEVINLIVRYEQPEENHNKVRLGIADGKYKIPDDINAFDDEIARMFDV